MIKWLACELHTHTNASDGDFTLQELAECAKAQGLDVLAITDHNTMHSKQEIEAVESLVGIHIISGLEWTTFYGHLVTMGLNDYVDWKRVVPDAIDEGIENIHQAGGIVGIAHPFRVGGPLATGCHFEFNVKNWAAVDYIEAWSNVAPNQSQANKKAFEFWTQKLNEGYELTGAYGRDWHRVDPANKPYAITYVGVRDTTDLKTEVMRAIKHGRVVVSMGPVMTLKAMQHETVVEVGDRLLSPANELAVCIEIDWQKNNSEDVTVILESNKGVLMTKALKEQTQDIKTTIETEEITWMRAILKRNQVMEAFTNPIYMRDMEDQHGNFK